MSRESYCWVVAALVAMVVSDGLDGHAGLTAASLLLVATLLFARRVS